MACHTTAKRKNLYSALSEIDPSVESADKFWHTRGRRTDGGVKVSNEEAERALDAVFMAAVSQGTGDPDGDWHEIDGDERLDLHLAWMRARNELMEEGLTAGQLAALSRYVTKKHQAAERAREAEVKQAVNEKTRNLKTRLGAVVGGLGLVSLVALAAASMGLSTAAPSNVPQTPDSVASQQVDQTDALNPSVRSVEAGKFTVGGKTVYTNMAKGKCAPGAVKTKVSKTQKVNWQWKNGNIGKKTVKKGKTVCKFTNAAGQTATAPTNAAGVMTALPSSFPKNPTAADIAKLGLTPDSKVAPNLRLPQPTGAPLAKGELPDTVRPTRGISVQDGVLRSDPRLATQWEKPVKFVTVEWQVAGGSGVLTYQDINLSDPTNTVVKNVSLNPAGSVTFTSTVMVDPSAAPVNSNGTTSIDFSGYVAPDYGQSRVPSSMTANWEVPHVKDESGVGMPVGKHANPGYYDATSGPKDGFVNVTPDGRVVLLNY